MQEKDEVKNSKRRGRKLKLSNEAPNPGVVVFPEFFVATLKWHIYFCEVL